MKAQPKILSILDVVSVVLLAIATGMVFLYAPVEVTMGAVQKVFYFHVAAAWAGMAGFGVATVCGIIYLRSHDRSWDIAAVAGVEIGLVFMLIAVIGGSIWARPIWNKWWAWDPRLATETIMGLAYAAPRMLRQGLEDPDRRARFGAVYAIIAFVSVPLTFLSIRFVRTIHPVVIAGSDPNATGAFDMSPRMLQTFLFSLFTFTVIFVDVYWHRLRLGTLADRIEQLKLRLLD
jgi:heme exporter protein C